MEQQLKQFAAVNGYRSLWRCRGRGQTTEHCDEIWQEGRVQFYLKIAWRHSWTTR